MNKARFEMYDLEQDDYYYLSHEQTERCDCGGDFDEHQLCVECDSHKPGERDE